MKGNLSSLNIRVLFGEQMHTYTCFMHTVPVKGLPTEENRV